MIPADPYGLYLHIPFCQAICSYCNFNRGLLDPDLKRAYVDALEREIRGRATAMGEVHGLETEANGTKCVDTIFFGGGTPSLLEPAEIARLIAACRETFDLAPDSEITLETNPETATAERLAAFKDAGVNRISFGVQSFNDAELKRLGRIHSAARAIEAIDAARRIGFDSVSFDLMLWLPEQTPAIWRETLRQAVALGPDHLSMYLLELYPNAPLKEEMARSHWSQTPDDDAADMYLEGVALLESAGYEQYEISNFAKPGHPSRHNLKYWTMGDWIGFGCGAHSTAGGVRWRNVSSTVDYVDRLARGAPVAIDRRVQTLEERVQEALFTGLRLASGIEELAFESRWRVAPWSRYASVLELRREAGHVWRSSGRFGLTKEGMLVANDVLSAFV